jgi:hypothetical protein
VAAATASPTSAEPKIAASLGHCSSFYVVRNIFQNYYSIINNKPNCMDREDKKIKLIVLPEK